MTARGVEGLSEAEIDRVLRKASQLRRLISSLPHAPTPRERALLDQFRAFRQGSGDPPRLVKEVLYAGFDRHWREGDYATIRAVGARLTPQELIEDPLLRAYVTQARAQATSAHPHGLHLFLYRELVLRLDDGVMRPKFGSTFLAEHCDARPGEAVLELGTGAGLVAILAARAGAEVVATDLLPACVACAAANAALNGVAGRVRALAGDLYAPVAGRRFDAIFMNPPQMPTPPGGERDDAEALADQGGPDGLALIARAVRGAPAHLRPGGCLVFTAFAFSGEGRILALAREAGLRPTVVARREQRLPRLALERLEYLRCLPGGATIARRSDRYGCQRLLVRALRA